VVGAPGLGEVGGGNSVRRRQHADGGVLVGGLGAAELRKEYSITLWCRKSITLWCR
jgi:hypothetical protein